MMHVLKKQLSVLVLFLCVVSRSACAEETGTGTHLKDFISTLSENAVCVFIVAFAVVLLLLEILILLYLNRSIKTRQHLKSRMITLSTIYNSLPDLVFSKDKRGTYTSCNRSYEEFVGLPESEIIGKTPLDIFPFDNKMAAVLMETDKKVLTGNVVSKTESWFIYPDRFKKLLETVKTPLIENGEVVGLLGISRDITEHKAAEESAYEASRTKSNFLAKMSH